MWLVVALAGACGTKAESKNDKSDRDGDAACDRLPNESDRKDCKTEFHKRGKTTEASLYLNKLGKAAKRFRVENGKYPIGDAQDPNNGPSCCGAKDNKCAPRADAFAKDPVWSKLEFGIDEPTTYQYEYHSSADGTGFTAYAFGDADCDQKVATFAMIGTTTAAGNPAINMVPPPSGVY